MPRFLVTSSLYGSWLYYRNAEHTVKADFLRTLRKEREAPTENMQKGIALENDVMQIVRGEDLLAQESAEYFSEDWLGCCKEIAEEVRGGLFQERVYRNERINDFDVLLYGKADCVRRDFIKDIKFTASYDLGKYSDSIQHDLYMHCSPAPSFRYIVSNGHSVWHEDYHQTAKSKEKMFADIYEMLCDIRADAEFNEAFTANWTSLDQTNARKVT